MKKYEFIGLLLAIVIILITYSFNYFYNDISSFINPNYVSANDFNTTINMNTNGNEFNPLVVKTSKIGYYRYELIDIYASYKDLNNDPITVGQLEAKVYKDNKLIQTIGETKSIPLKYNPKLGLWTGKWPIPYNPELGTYQVLVRAMPPNPGPVITSTWNFNVMGRTPKKPENGICAIVLEYGGTVLGRKIEGPDGKKGDWRNIIKWAKFTGANSFFMLGAETKSYDHMPDDQPFDEKKLKEVEKFGIEVKKNKLNFGAWSMTFGLQGRKYEKYNYKASMAFSKEKQLLYPSWMHISLIDKQRFKDILKVAKRFNANPNIDFIGFDYIRTGHADGYEMAEYVIQDMSIPVPSNWDKLSSTQRMIWFANKVKDRKDMTIIEKWDWWRAHKIAETLNKIITLSGTKKPVWVFSLGWEHGKQHGQDPLMFMDAGVSFDAVMLYEANQVQFRRVIADWKSYIASQQVNILVGQTVDTSLLDSPYLLPPEEFCRRLLIGTKKIAFGGLTDGLFWHDVSRALWGRKGNYSTKEWFITAAKCFSEFRKEKGEVGIILDTKIQSSENNRKNLRVNAYIENQTINRIDNIKIKLEKTDGIYILGRGTVNLKHLSPGEIKIIPFNVEIKPVGNRYQYMVAVSAITKDNQRAFDFQYVNPSRRYSQKLE